MYKSDIVMRTSRLLGPKAGGSEPLGSRKGREGAGTKGRGTVNFKKTVRTRQYIFASCDRGPRHLAVPARRRVPLALHSPLQLESLRHHLPLSVHHPDGVRALGVDPHAEGLAALRLASHAQPDCLASGVLRGIKKCRRERKKIIVPFFLPARCLSPAW